MKHLTVEQKYTISVMLKQGKMQKEIAETIGRDKSVISREISRNKDARNGEYRDGLANRKYNERQKGKRKHIRFTLEIKAYVKRLIEDEYSPEQIVGVSKNEGVSCVSHETIYQYLWQEKRKGGYLYNQLRRKGRRYRKRGNNKDSRGIIKGRIDIDQRPEIVDKKERFGDLEIDTIIGKDHKGAIVTINDRASGMLKMKKVKTKEAFEVEKATIELLKEWEPYLKTITADNGKEFANHQQIADNLKIDFYFAKPYHSWERGANENLNGLIRQYIPKKTDFDTITDVFVEYVQNKLNNRPRKRFDYKSPMFVRDELLFNQKVALIT